MEPGERVLGALHRELHEETGREVETEWLVAAYSDPDYQIARYPTAGTFTS